MNTITIREYGAFCEGKKNGDSINGYVTLEKKTFSLLEAFALENNRDGKDDALEIMGISARRGIGKIITVKNYVGVIALNDGTTIEILPKIHSNEDSDNARQLVVNMLNTLYNVSSKNLQTAKLNVCKMNILEAFIRMFVDEVIRLIKQGLKSDYETLEDNLTCVKGKIQFSQHIRHNFAHNERVYVAYDEFTVNRPENKLLKSTLLYLHSHTRSSRNKKDIKNLLSIFSDVEPSSNYDADFSRIVLDRNTKAYSNALNWARIFLKKKSFTSFSGSTVSMALLFPMEKLFECYIPALMQKMLIGTNFTLLTQDKRYHLFDDPKCFLLKPDIVLIGTKQTFIMDTKWKKLNGDLKSNYGISQSDMYQMYAYYQKYNKNATVPYITLIYPRTDETLIEQTYKDNITGAEIRICFVDLSDDKKTEKSLNNILSPLFST